LLSRGCGTATEPSDAILYPFDVIPLFIGYFHFQSPLVAAVARRRGQALGSQSMNAQQPPSPSKYLERLNLKTREEAYQYAKRMASNLTEDEHTVRSCIFDLHASVEFELRTIYYHLFKQLLFLADDKAKNDKTLPEFDKTISNVSFGQMHNVLRPILNKWYGDFKAIGAINETRNLAVHQSDITKVLYKGRSPFSDADCFAQMSFDVWASSKRCRNSSGAP
jgi:hypothetical protein